MKNGVWPVSYTHLEEAAALFLSEGKPGVLYGQSGDTEYGEAVNEGTQTLLTYYMAVSYTHLDVYKRQREKRRDFILRCDMV